MNLSRRITWGFVLFWMGMGALHALAQGSLTPPIGPPQPTMKTLQQVEPRTAITNIPFTISQPGSYYLTTNLTATTTYEGINITSSDVTIDLMGFTLDGAGMGTFGIIENGSYKNVKICNGNVVQWQYHGLYGVGSDAVYENVVSRGNGHGFVAGDQARITSCTAVSNASGLTLCYGISFGNGGVIQDSMAIGNTGVTTGYGIYGGNNAQVLRCQVRQNSGTTVYGILVETNSMVSDCVVEANGLSGDGFGIKIEGGGSVLRCQVRNNGNNSVDNGIYLEGFGGSVLDCVVIDNSGRGILVEDQCVVKGNTCNGHKIGIYADGSRNRIENNLCASNTSYGIYVPSSKSNNIVIANFAVENGNDYYVPTANNIKGPETSVMTNHPWANFATP
jgi:parallel beta-helix repeat protein